MVRSMARDLERILRYRHRAGFLTQGSVKEAQPSQQSPVTVNALHLPHYSDEFVQDLHLFPYYRPEGRTQRHNVQLY